jgi:RNA polymerase sigma factor (sigma-70 family)
MAAPFPATSLNLLTKLKKSADDDSWNVSWKRFLELYHEPLTATTRACYRHHTSGHEPAYGFIEEVVAQVVTDFFSKSQFRYDATKGRLRSYLRLLVNSRVIDLLRKEQPINQQALPDSFDDTLPAESLQESESFHRSLLATLVEDLRNHIPMRQFEIFERVKLKHQSPSFVAEDLGMTRAMIDRNIHKALTALRQLATHPEYQQEFYP